MSSAYRRTSPAVIHRLVEQPQKFEFFQALRVLQQWLPPATRGERMPLSMRLRKSLSLLFPVSEIESLTIHRDESTAAGSTAVGAGAVRRIEIVPAVMGLLGVTGTLPTGYTDVLAQRERYQRDEADGTGWTGLGRSMA